MDGFDIPIEGSSPRMRGALKTSAMFSVVAGLALRGAGGIILSERRIPSSSCIIWVSRVFRTRHFDEQHIASRLAAVNSLPQIGHVFLYSMPQRMKQMSLNATHLFPRLGKKLNLRAFFS